MSARRKSKSSFLLESECSNCRSESLKYGVGLPLTWRPESPRAGGAVQPAVIAEVTVPGVLFLIPVIVKCVVRFSAWVSKPNVLESYLQGALDQHFINWKCIRYNLAIHMFNTKYWSRVDKAVEGDTVQPRKSSKGMRIIQKLNVAVNKEGLLRLFSGFFSLKTTSFYSKRKAVQEGGQSQGICSFPVL